MPESAEQVSASPFPDAAFDVVALAASAGGLTALGEVLGGLPPDFPAAVVVVQHLDPRHRSLMAEVLRRRTLRRLKHAEEGERLAPGTVYVAPPDRHLLANANWRTRYAASSSRGKPSRESFGRSH
jgi:two-component system chemotaxis response regulator CheB